MHSRFIAIGLAILVCPQYVIARRKATTVPFFAARRIVALGVSSSRGNDVRRRIHCSQLAAALRAVEHVSQGASNVSAILIPRYRDHQRGHTYFWDLVSTAPGRGARTAHGRGDRYGGVLAEGLQMTIGRARPAHDVNNAFDFQFGKGFSSDDYTSLPSTHATVAFAAATAATREVARSWPGATSYVAPISYTAATLVGLSRMYKNRHWASDVVESAGLGAYSAVLFDRYNEAHPGNIFERLFLPTSVIPAPRSFTIAWALRLN
jgi:membrane-associated phospholipid phosphatase